MYNFDADIRLDLSNDPDICALESEMSMIDYAIESASFEVELGNDEFSRVLEAAFDKKAKTGDSWFSQIAAKVSAFVDRIIKFFTGMINKVRAFMSGKKAKKDADKVKKGLAIGGAVAGTIAVGAGIYAIVKNRKQNSLSDDMKLLEEGIKAEDYSKWKSTKMSKAQKETYKKAMDEKQYRLTADEIMRFMNANVSSANDLNKFVKAAEKRIKQLPKDYQSKARDCMNAVIAKHSGDLSNNAAATKNIQMNESVEDRMRDADAEYERSNEL